MGVSLVYSSETALCVKIGDADEQRVSKAKRDYFSIPIDGTEHGKCDTKLNEFLNVMCNPTNRNDFYFEKCQVVFVALKAFT